MNVSDVQENVSVSGNAITGTSKYLESVNTFDMSKGHHFIVLHVTADTADTIKVSMDPTQSSLTTLDESGVIILQMKDDQSQTVKIVAENENGTTTKNLTISGMTFAADSEEVTGASLQNDVMTKLEAKFGANKVAVIKTDFIGAGFSSSLAIKSAFLLLLTIVCIWIYAAFRFHWDFALGSVIALLHDVCIMFTFIIWSNMEFTTTVLAAILTIIGYSINATVVILDRVRDNLSMQKVTKFNEILNKSLSDTLARSILTTVTTLFAVVSLYIFTTGSIKDFALAVIVGLFSGCYSSMFISGGFISAGRKNWKPEFGVHHSEKSMKKGVLQMDSGVTV